MSSTQSAVVNIAYAPVAGFPAGSAVATVDVTAVAANPANSPADQSVAPETPTVTFLNLQPDTYTISAQAFDANGNGFGSPVSVTITITSVATVSLNLPSAVTASQP